MSGILDERGRLRANPGRPWSVAEIEEGIPVVMERIEDALTDLKSMGDTAASLKWTLTLHEAIARQRVRPLFEGSRSAKEDRDAAAVLYVFVPEDLEPYNLDLDWVGHTVFDVGMAKEIADNAYDTQRTIIRALERNLAVLQTLHVSGRSAP